MPYVGGNICYDLVLILAGLELFSQLVDALALSGSTLAAAIPERPAGNLGRGRARLFQMRHLL